MKKNKNYTDVSFFLSQMSKKIQTFDNIDKTVGKQALSIFTGRNINWYDPMAGNLATVLKIMNAYIL